MREEEPVDVVVVDDGSTDVTTLQTLDRLRDAGTRVLRQENAGLSAARNTALAATTARYVFPLDGDDVLLAGSLRLLADVLDADDSISFAYGDYDMFGARDARWTLPEWDPWALLYTNFWSPSLMFRRSALEEVGGWAWHGCAEDWAILMALAERNHRGRRCPVVTHRQRQAAGRMTSVCRTGTASGSGAARPEQGMPRCSRGRRELRRASRPALWKQVVYPAFLGSRRLYPPRLEDALWPVRKALRAGTAKPPSPVHHDGRPARATGMRIALVSTALPADVGGVETHVEQLAIRLAARRHTVDVLTHEPTCERACPMRRPT